MMNKRFLTATFGVASLATTTAVANKPEVKENGKGSNPNIILILADDLGYGDLSCQYSSDMHTPNIDRLFEGGVRLDRFYANSNVSSPSRAGLLTGRYPLLVGVPGVIREGYNFSHGWLSSDAVLLPKLFNQAGYNTAHVGKWHLGLKTPNLPNERGFQYFAGFLGDMMDDYYTHIRKGNNYMRFDDKPTDVGKGIHATELFTDWTIDYIEKQKNSPSPFFLYLAYNAPHVPLQPPKEWEEKVLKREKGITPVRAKLVAMVEQMDHHIGRIIESLKANGQFDNTLIIFSSDNGGFRDSESNNGPTRGAKGDMYEGGIRVPCAFYWKNGLSPARLNDVVMMSDIFPTLCELVGAPITHPVDGISVLPLLQGKKQDTGDRYLFWTKVKSHDETGERRQTCVRYRDDKIVRQRPDAKYEYFNLNSDPMEENVITPAGERYKTMLAKLREHLAQGDKVPIAEPGVKK